MPELVKNIELSLLEPTKCKLKQLDKLYSEYLACAKETFSFWQSNKGITQNILHHSTYKQFRLKYKIPAQLIIRARGIVWNRRKITDKIKRLPIDFDLRCFRYGKTKRKTPFFAFSGMVKSKMMILPVAKNRLFQRFESHISNGWIFKSCQLVKRDKWFLQVCVKKEFTCKESGDILGIDINAGNIALTIMNREKKILRQLYLGQDIPHKRRKIEIRKVKLRSIYDKTFSNRALRSLRNISRFEYNFVRTRLLQINNQIVKLANEFKVSHIIIEDLKNLRVGRKLRNSKGRKVNKIINKIPYAKFRNALNIIATQQRINIIAIDPYHTSQFCSRCRALNKIKGGNYKLYKCKSCGLEINRDRNASKNICNFLLERGMTNSGKISSSQISNRQVPVNAPLLSRDVCI